MDALINCNVRIEKLELLIDKLIAKNIYQQRQLENQQLQIDRLTKSLVSTNGTKQTKEIAEPTTAKPNNKSTTKKVLCTFCSSNHRDEDCSFPLVKRWQAIKRLNHCPQCLIEEKHSTLTLCKAPKCEICTGNHHRLLCARKDPKKLTHLDETNTISSTTGVDATELDNIPLPRYKPDLQPDQAIKLINTFSSIPDFITPLDPPSLVNKTLTSKSTDGVFKIPKLPAPTRKRKENCEPRSTNNLTVTKKPKIEHKQLICIEDLFGDVSP